MGCYTQEVKLNVIAPSPSYFIKTENIFGNSYLFNLTTVS